MFCSVCSVKVFNLARNGEEKRHHSLFVPYCIITMERALTFHMLIISSHIPKLEHEHLNNSRLQSRAENLQYLSSLQKRNLHHIPQRSNRRNPSSLYLHDTEDQSEQDCHLRESPNPPVH